MNREIEIYNEATHSLSLNNSGTLNKQNLLFAKRTVLFDAVRSHADDLVTHKQGYPQNDISEVHLECDFVILSRREYDELKRIKKDSEQYAHKIRS